jgi:RHS repeat-associated protein
MLTHGSATLVYDGDGNRVSETVGNTTTKYLVDTLNPTGYAQVLDEIVNGSVTRTYTYGRQLISENQLVGSTWTPSFYGYDGHGNVRFLANSAGTVTDTYTFDAFGAPIASTGTTPNVFQYSDEWLDPNLNFYNLRARWYNALTGRFETMDSDSGKITDPSTLHKYVYTRNNPVNRLDPRGTSDAGEEDVLFENLQVFRQGFSAWRQRLAAACEDRVDQWVLSMGRTFSADEMIVILSISTRHAINLCLRRIDLTEDKLLGGNASVNIRTGLLHFVFSTGIRGTLPGWFEGCDPCHP